MSNHGDASLSLAGFKQVCVFTVQLCIFSVADFRSSLAKDKYFSLGVELVIWAKTRLQAFALEERWQIHHCTMCILSSRMALWSKAEIQKYTF